MNVSIKQFDVKMDLKNRGIELEVRSANGEDHLGDLIVTKTSLIWCEGRTRRENGKRLSWTQFRDWVNDRT